MCVFAGTTVPTAYINIAISVTVFPMYPVCVCRGLWSLDISASLMPHLKDLVDFKYQTYVHTRLALVVPNVRTHSASSCSTKRTYTLD